MKWYERFLQATLGRLVDMIFKDDKSLTIGDPNYRPKCDVVWWLYVAGVVACFGAMVWLWLR